MTNLDIETFWAVVQHGTMTAAAEALYITQPTLSMRMVISEQCSTCCKSDRNSLSMMY